MKKIEKVCFLEKRKWQKLVLEMKLTILILFLCMMQVSAAVYSQASKFSFDFSNRQVIDVLKDIEDQSEYRFFYQDEQIDVSRRVSLQVSDQPLDEILRDLFKGQHVSYKIMNNKMILLTSDNAGQDSSSGLVQQQKFTVSGEVTDPDGAPLPGVTIVVQGTKTGVITDVNGKYTLTNVPADAVLMFSFVGMKSQQVPVAGKSKIDVSMESAIESVDEVVVVGYGTQKAKNITGSIATISVDNIKSLPVSNLAESLYGQVPGLSVNGGSTRPGESASLSIRQSYSWSKDGGNKVPLVIIDDVIQVDPTTGNSTLDQLNMLDPSEIESITVLRDASAAIYGARASQGAIIVKTKHGKKGLPTISYSGQFSWNDAISHTKTMSAYEYGEFANSFLRASGTTDSKYLFSDDELGAMKSLNYDWLKKAWKSASQQHHSLTVNGGSERATYFAGVSYFDQGANLGGQDYSRWNFRTGLDVQLTNNLKLTASVSANKGDQEKSFTKVVGSLSDSSYGSKTGGEQADYGFLVHMPKYIPWSYTVDGTEQWVSPSLGPYKRTSNLNSANQIGSWNYFALLDAGDKQVTESFSYNANFALNYDIPFIKGLGVKGTYAITQSYSDTEQDAFPYTLAMSTNSNSSDTHLYTDGTTWQVTEVNKNSRVVYGDDYSKYEQMNLYLTYNRKFGKHDISAMASIERSTINSKSKKLFYESPESSDTYNGASNSAGTLSDSNTYTERDENGTLGYLGRVNYNYADKYMVQFLFRTDASSKFAPENYWGFFPNLSLGWTISEEPWFKDNIPWIDYLKIRQSLGKTGRDNVSSYRWVQKFDYSSNKGIQFGTSDGGTLGSSLSASTIPNRDVHWDKSIKENFGFDAAMLDNRVRVSWDFYYDWNSDILMTTTATAAISAGGGYAEQNYAAINSWGSEISVNWSDKIGNLKYKIGITSDVLTNNKVKKYPESGNTYPSSNNTREGSSTYFPTWGFKIWKGTSTGDGILRTDDDISNYWNYLTENATAAGNSPSYMGITSESGMKKGYLAYQDLYGDLNDDGTLTQEKNGKIVAEEDYVKLVKKDNNRGFTTSLGLEWKGISWSTLISTYWGAYRSIDVVKQGTSSNQMLWAHESYNTDMYDADYNTDGKYPNLAYYSYISQNSDFWQLSSFRCFVKNMTIGYSLPKLWTSKLKIDNAKISLVGTNLWDFFNPYPGKYRNMYDNSYENYPTLRTWSMSVNLTF